MPENVTTFKVNHSKLIPGIYLCELRETEDGFITIFDVRFKKPNGGDYLTPIESHTISHVLNSFFSKYFKDKVFFGPMACLTGFYLVLNDMHTVEDVVKSLDTCDAFWDDLLKENKVPGKAPMMCGNYKLLDIKAGYNAWKSFFLTKANWGKEYPILEEEIDIEPYQNDIDPEIRLK